MENKRKLRDVSNSCRQTTSKLVFLHPANTGAISWFGSKRSSQTSEESHASDCLVLSKKTCCQICFNINYTMEEKAGFDVQCFTKN